MSTNFNDEIFNKAFEKAEISKLNPTEMDSYQSSLKIFRDNKGVRSKSWGVTKKKIHLD